ncbi:MAG: secretin N-terminal domain-containing protein [Gemmatimonadota bacterium]
MVVLVAVLFWRPAQLGAQQRTDVVRVTAQGLMLDFQDADLKLVIAALAEAGGLSVVYGELPAKRVTLRTNQPLPLTQIPAVLRSLSESNGLAIRDEGSFLRIDVVSAQAAAATQQAATQQEEARLFVHRLKHARAARLAATLQALFGRSGAAFQPGLSNQPLSERLRQQRLPATDTAPRPAAVPSIPQALPSLPAQLHGEVQIVPDEMTNALLVRAQPADWEIVRQAVEALDLRPLQVLIEVVIAEVRRNKNLAVGVSANAESRSGNTSGELKASAPSDFLLRMTRSGSIDIDLALSALSSTGEVRILSRPVVLAQNNQEARILIGAERPFVQVFRSLPTDAGVRDQVVQYRDVGTSLTILPTINSDGYVNLQVVQEVSTATSETQFGAPVISTREAATHLFARNGQTVVIGGLVEHQEDKSRTGIPLLKEIPLLGALFGSTRIDVTNSELFLFLTPRIVQSDADADEIRNGIEKNSELLRKLQPIKPLLPPIRRDSIGGGR